MHCLPSPDLISLQPHAEPGLCIVQDQGQYWARQEPYKFQPVSVFAEAFKRTQQGRANLAALDQPHYTGAKEAGLDPLARSKCALLADVR